MKRLLAILGVPLLALGCAGSFEESRGSVRVGAPEVTARCASLDDQHRTWGAVAKGAGVVAGGLGALELPSGESQGVRVGLGAGVLAAGAVAATAVFVSEDAAGRYVAECAK